MAKRIGINIGDVVQEGDRIYGDGINIPARLESLAKPGGICISGIVTVSIFNEFINGHKPNFRMINVVNLNLGGVL